MVLALLPVLVLAAGGAAPPAGAGGQVVEEMVAVIRFPSTGESTPITLTRLMEEGRIALISRGGIRAATQPLDAAALRAALEWLVDQTVLLDEVTRLNVFEVGRKDVLDELARFQRRFQKPEDYQAFMKKLDLSPDELMVVLRRMLKVQRYVASRLGGSTRVRDADVEAYYQGHRKDFAGSELSAVREAVRAHLVEERLQTDLRALLADLRSRCEIRMLVDLEAVAAEGR